VVFGFVEQMSGTWRRRSQPALLLPARFECAAVADLRRYARDGHMALSGHIRFEGLAGYAACQGALDIQPLRRRLRYELAFLGDDGRRYTLRGEKRLRYRDLLRAMTYLPAEIRDEAGAAIGDAELRFDLRDLPGMLRSMGRTLLEGERALEPLA
jgi:hypothetical protein